jgi:hypothetical protein
MAKTTVVINDNIHKELNKYIEKKRKTVPVSIRTVVNNALDLYLNDVSNKEILAAIKKIK